MQFKLTTAFVLIGAVLAVVNAAATADAPVVDIPATDEEAQNPDVHFVYVNTRAETTDEEAYNPDVHFAYGNARSNASASM
ncbi:hypothetical protein BS17DRAFT_882880 [Gyrodon lividus]|nr:hypothetical protein BS17DRAFT_882880 [Gyrodon lividus]